MIHLNLLTPKEKYKFLLRFLKENKKFSRFVKNRFEFINSTISICKTFIPEGTIPIDDLILRVNSSFCWSDTPEGEWVWAHIDAVYRDFIAHNLMANNVLNNMFYVKKEK